MLLDWPNCHFWTCRLSVLDAMMQGWSAESNMFAGYGGGYPYAPVGAAVQPPQQQRGTTGDELAADLMRAAQAVRQ